MRIWTEATTVSDLLIRTAENRPHAEAIVFPERRCSYSELVEAAVRAGRGLKALGIQRGDHVGILMPNCMEFVEIFFGATMIGAVVVPINARFKAKELSYVIENADLVALFTTDIIDEHVNFVDLLVKSLPGLGQTEDSLALNLPEAPKLRSIVIVGKRIQEGFVSQREFYHLASRIDPAVVERARERVCIREVALLMYTSGTTSQPKGCLLSHEAMVRTPMAVSRERFLIGPEDRFWNPLPMFHMGSILPMLATIDGMGTFLTMTHFDADTALRMISGERATIIYPTFPTITQAILNHSDFPKTDLSTVRVMNNVAPPEILRAMQRALPHAIQIGAYGCTEITGTASFNELTETEEQRIFTCGRPFRGIEVKIIDMATGETLAQGERGEICVRGYSVCEGYYKDPEKTAETIDKEGWFHTGDLCSLDPDGRIVYLGRIKDMLKVGGENVAAAEIESHLGTYPGVVIVQVVGVPDERLVEVPAAFVELAPGARVSERELIKHCKGQIASFKIPRYIKFVKEWPLSATKIQKFRLKEQWVDAMKSRQASSIQTDLNPVLKNPA